MPRGNLTAQISEGVIQDMTLKSLSIGTVLGALAAFMSLPVLAQTNLSTVETAASYAVLMDAESGEVFFEKDSDTPMAPASMSKLMTVAVVFDALKQGIYTLDDTFTVSRNAWKKQGSKMWVLVGTEISIADLLRGIIVQSGNDACIVVAEGMEASEEAFAARMTKFGREIGLTNSVFKNSTGWPDPEHVMSARDLATLARYLITEHPDLYQLFAETDFEWSDINQPNRNPLLLMNMGADGLKTGHTDASGYGLVGSAVRGDRRIIAVLNGLRSSSERAKESRRLLNVGFREFKSYELFAAGSEIGKAQVWMGDTARIPLMVNSSVKVNVHRRARKGLVVKLAYNGPIKAPVQAGDEVGVLKIEAPGMTPKTVPVYAARDVEKAGFTGRILEALAFKLYGLRQG